MREWRDFKLEELCIDFAMGPFGSNIKAENFVSSGVPVIKGKNLNYFKYVSGDFDYLTDEKADDLRKSNCFPDDLVFTHRGTIGQVGLIPHGAYERYVVSQSGMKLTTDTEKVIPEFLFYFFKSDHGQYELLKNEAQVGVPSISSPLSSLKSVELTLPPLEEQKAIAEVLASLDDKIDFLHKQNQTLEALAQTLFRHTFIDNAGEDWEEKPLKDVCKILNGYAFKSPTYQENGQKIIRTMNFNRGLVNLDGLVFISDELATQHAKYYLDRKDFLLVMVGASLGNYAVVTSDILPALQNQNMWRFKAHYSQFQNYLNFAIREIVKENFHSASGSARQFFQKTAFYEFEIVVPDQKALVEFDAFAESTFCKVEANKRQIQTLENLRDTLLPKLMSGDVRVAYKEGN